MIHGFRCWILATVLAASCSVAAQAADHLAQARQMLAQGDLRGAQIQLRNAVRNDPTHAVAHYLLARVDLLLGDAVAAEKEARAAREAGYDAAAATSLLGQSYLAEGRASDLLKDFKPPQKAPPAVAASILVARGLALLDLGDPDKAQAALAEAERLAPQSPEPLLAQERLAVSHNDLATAQQKIDRALALDPHSQEAMLRKGRLLEMKGDRAGALAAYDAVVALAPDNYAGRLARAGMLIATGQLAKAKNDVDATLAALPNSATGVYLRAILLVEAGDYKGADAHLEMLSRALVRFQRGYFYQALVKQHLGQMEQAAEAAERYAARSPNDPDGAKLLAEIELQTKRPDRAINTLRRIASADARDWQVYDLLGRAYEGAGSRVLAEQAFQKAVTLAPGNAGLLDRLAAARLKTGDTSGALRDLERSLQLIPVQPGAQQMLGEVALLNGDMARASDELEKLRKQQGDTAVVGSFAGLIKLAHMDLDGAQAQFEAVLKAHPDWVPAKLDLARVYAIEGKTGLSRKLLTEVLAQQPTSTLALSNLVSGLLREGKAAQAVQVTERAHQAAAGSVEITLALARLYVQTGDPKKALALIDQIGQNQALGIPLLAARAESLAALGRKDEARDIYRQLLGLDPSDVPLRLKLAALLTDAKDYEGARTLLQDGLSKRPGNYQLLSGLVAVDLRSGGPDAALTSADRLQKLPANLPAAALLPGDIYMSQRRFGDAVAAYSAAMKIAPSPPLVLRLAQAISATGQPDKAQAALQDWLAHHPDDLDAADILAGMEIAANRLEAAEGHLTTVLERRPNDAIALNNLAWIYQQRSDPRARSVAEHAYLIAPIPQISDTLGWILTQQGDGHTGLLLLRDAVSHMPNDSTMRYHLAVALKQTGQRDEAIKLLTQLVAGPENLPSKPEARRALDELSAGK